MVQDDLKLVGIVEIYENEVLINTIKNLFTVEGYKNLLDLVSGNSTGYTVDHFAVGSGSSNVSSADTIVDGEYARLSIDNQYQETIDGYTWLVNELNLQSGEGNGTIRKLGLIARGPNTTLANYNASDPNESGHEWRLSNAVDVLMPNGKSKTSDSVLKFIWKWRLG